MTEETGTPRPTTLSERLAGLVESAILASRYFLVPLMLGLTIVILMIGVDFYRLLVEGSAPHLREHVLRALEFVDVMMIGNLIWLISAGSYYVFVDNHYPLTSGKKRPRCLAHVSSGILKEKMAGSLVGVSSITLLHMFLNMAESKESVDPWRVGVMLAIHIVFILGLLAFNRSNEGDHHQHAEEEREARQQRTNARPAAH